MDQDVAQAIADVRSQLAELRAALGAPQPGQAVEVVAGLRLDVAALSAWAQTVTPAFQPPEGSQA